MQKLKFFLLMCLLVQWGPKPLLAQQDPIYGQYIFNSTVLNPAQAGVFEQSQWGVVYRNQWAGIDGAPITKSFFTNFRMKRKLGGAVAVYQDEIGPINDVTLQGDVAYPVRLNEQWTLSGGLRAMGSRITANFSELQNIQPGDPNFNQNLSSGIFFNMGLGLLIYSDRAFVGASIPKAISRTFEGQELTNSKLKQHIFVYGGLQLPMKSDWVFTPSLMARFVANSPFQMDVNALFKYKNTIDMGVMLRSADAAGVLFGVYMNEKWYLGYQYEYPLQDIQQVTRQTHEIALRFLWDSKYRARIRSPRYFI